MSQQIVKGRKFPQVLEGARSVFLRDGYEGASVDEIARESGVSKATLYSYFPDKRLMFIEVFRRELDRQIGEGAGLGSVDAPASTILTMVAEMLARHLVSDFGRQTYRLAVGGAARFPELARDYYESGPAELRRQLSAYFARCVARGELQIDDMEIAAEQFIELSSVKVQDNAQFLGPESVDDALISRVSTEACKTFLARYGVAGR